MVPITYEIVSVALMVNGRYKAKTGVHQVLCAEDLENIIGLFRMTFADADIVHPDVRGKPIYLGVARNGKGKLKLKPQNLLVNLPLAGGGEV